MGLRRVSLDAREAVRNEIENPAPEAGKHATPALERAFFRPVDQVLKEAFETGMIGRDRIASASFGAAGSDAALTWRQVAHAMPETGDRLFELAARLYGFRSIFVCQIGTLIYNSKLTEFFADADWNRLFDRGVVPVIEHGVYPDVVRHHLLATCDPGSPHIRSLLHGLPLSRTELVFVPRAGIYRLQSMLSKHVESLAGNPFVQNRMQSLEAATGVHVWRKAA